MTGQASVIDGDTIDIHGTRIRLHGIDAPESGQPCTINGKAWPCGRRAAFALSDKIKGHTVECRPKDTDRYGRSVAVCRANGDDVSGWMVEQGWAVAYRRYSLDYVNEERHAANARRGIWQGEFEAPEDWRRNHSVRTTSPRSEGSPAKPKFVTPP
jgi:endonuclease YncB( thermonuclease family)